MRNIVEFPFHEADSEGLEIRICLGTSAIVRAKVWEISMFTARQIRDESTLGANVAFLAPAVLFRAVFRPTFRRTDPFKRANLATPVAWPSQEALAARFCQNSAFHSDIPQRFDFFPRRIEFAFRSIDCDNLTRSSRRRFSMRGDASGLESATLKECDAKRLRDVARWYGRSCALPRQCRVGR